MFRVFKSFGIKRNFQVSVRITSDRRVPSLSATLLFQFHPVIFCVIELRTTRRDATPERIMQRPRTTQTFSLAPAISSSLCRVVGNVDACGHFARNVSPDAPRDIRRQKRGTSPTSIIMCVTCEGEETSFYVQSLSGVSCSPRALPAYPLNKEPLRRAAEGVCLPSRYFLHFMVLVEWCDFLAEVVFEWMVAFLLRKRRAYVMVPTRAVVAFVVHYYGGHLGRSVYHSILIWLGSGGSDGGWFTKEGVAQTAPRVTE